MMSGVQPKFKRRKFSAIRDFPRGFAGTENVVEAGGPKISEIRVESAFHEAVRNPVQEEEKEKFLDDLVRNVFAKLSTIVVEQPKCVANYAVELQEGSKMGGLAPVVKNVDQTQNKTDPVGNAKSWSPPQWPLSGGNIEGQPELAWKEMKKSKKLKTREGLCVEDISGGKESFPIFALNTIDKQKPPPFIYVTRMVYSNNYLPIPSKGCDCVGGCINSQICSCARKNGGEIPYNFNGAIVETKSLVYECGPSCKCPPSCYNRVSQHGNKIQLEIFKTERTGWGVRSLSSISSGSFICEYIGEMIEDKEGEQRTYDEYLFDIGQNYSDCYGNSDENLSADEVLEDGVFTIDAAKYGNVGRFINHSCSPNLYAQNVLYDHDDKKMSHIMLFAAEDIPPLKELTFHYNYKVDQVHDSNGNIKVKRCYCDSTVCTGRMY